MKKQIKTSSSIGSEQISELNNIFLQLSGETKPDTMVVLEKTTKLNEKLIRLKTLLKLFCNFAENLPQFCDVKSIESWRNDIQPIPVSPVDHWIQYKKSTSLQIICDIAAKLHPQVMGLRGPEVEQLFPGFMNEIAFEVHLFPNIPSDIKGIYFQLPSERVKKTFLHILHSIYKTAHAIWEIKLSPDADIQRVSELLIQSLTSMKSQIVGCDDAFKSLENAVDLLKSNFNSYYQNSRVANNPNIILESFILDVSKEYDDDDVSEQTPQKQKTNAKIRKQFAKIVQKMISQANQMGHTIPDGFKKIFNTNLPEVNI
jgi:hypothetical protein